MDLGPFYTTESCSENQRPYDLGMTNYPLKWGWHTDPESDASEQPHLIALLPSMLGGAHPDVVQAAANIGRSAHPSGPSSPPVGSERGERQGYLDAPGGGGSDGWCSLIPNIEQFGFCLYLCPNGQIKRQGKRLVFRCTPRIPPSGGIDLEY